MKIKKGDKVIIVSGKDRGKTGKVLRAFPRKNQVVVEGINVAKKHQAARRRDEKGQIIDKTMPIDVSNVMLADPKGGKPTRVGHRLDGKAKVRIARKSGAEIK